MSEVVALRKTYNHFWKTGPEEAKNRSWAALIHDTRKIVENQADHIYFVEDWKLSSLGDIQLDGWRYGPAEYGVFRLLKSPAAFCFCRTNRTAYDIPVTSILLAAKVRLGDWIKLTSDGRWNDWKPAMNLCQELLGFTLDDLNPAKTDIEELWYDAEKV